MRNLKNKIVKKLAVLALAVAGLGFGTSQTFAQDADGSAPIPAVAADYQPRTMDDLQQLAGPVALYPDALLAQVMVAATYPNDVAAAAQYLQNGGDPNNAGGNGWDASVVGLLQTPDALNQLAGDADWMNQLGDAFLNQQADLMNAVQLLRQQAQTAGNLCDTPQQQVVTADNCIQIVPTDPQVIYVPVYDPGIVYVRRVGFGPCITFCPGVRVGLWLHEDYDWSDHRIYVGDWGFNRPWWNRGSRGYDYVHIHPGIYARGGDVRGRSISWSHNNSRGVPTHLRTPEISRNRTNFRPANIPSHGPKASGIALRPNRSVPAVPTNVTHNVTTFKKSTNVVTNHNTTSLRQPARVTTTNHNVSTFKQPAHVVTSHTVSKTTTHTTAAAMHNVSPAISHRTVTTSHTTSTQSHQVASSRSTTHAGSSNIKHK